MITLSPPREQELIDALAEAFTPEDLDLKVADPLKIPAVERSGARDVKERARALVKWAAKNGVDTLVNAALRGNPSSSRLRLFAASIGLLASPDELLAAVRAAPKFVTNSSWMRGLEETQRQVCGIKMLGSSGETECTGFLVGDDQVMTVGFPVVPTPGLAITFAFDAVTVQIHPNDPVVVDLDQVRVLRLEAPLARALEKPAAAVAVRTRGWISPVPGTSLADEDRIVIVQHIDGSLSVSIGMYEGMGTGGDELTYQTDTYSGSLGAPCFDAAWRLVGIHIGGERGLNRGRTQEAIVRSLKEKGYRWDGSNGVYQELGAPPQTADPNVGKDDAIVRGIASSIEPDDVWSDEAEDLDLDKQECWAWVEAAAVHASFNPEEIVPFGETRQETRVALLLESRQIGDRWVLKDGIRKAALTRLASRGSLAEAHGKNPVDHIDRLDVALGSLIHQVPPKADDLRDPDTLRALLTAIGWLDGVVTPLPDPGRLRASLERAILLAPFQHLTRGFFAGREQELADLTAYSEAVPGSPLFIYGPGGMGKSALLARFVLQNAERDPADPDAWRPFIYIDFDRPELDATNLTGVLLAIIRQLGPQVPGVAKAAQALVDGQVQRDGPSTRRGARRKRGNIAAQVASGQLATMLDGVKNLLEELPDIPIVMILDTLEEVQFYNPDAIAPLISLVGQLQAHAPQLRPILAGRVLVDDDVAPMELGGLPLPACVALLQNELPAELATNTQLVDKLAEIVAVPDKNDQLRGNPLSLRLAAEALRREAAAADRVIEELDTDMRGRVGDAIVQGRLYERILGHIHDKRVAALAHPGLALRVITWELIRDVLAVPCGLGTIDEAASRDLFDALAKEVALVRQGADPAKLELRPELRRIVREDMARDTKQAHQRMQIHEAAVDYYEPRPLLTDRAEEIYHRLALGEDSAMVDKRWLTGVETFLRDAVGELPPGSNAYLANRVGGVADEKQLTTASPLEWEEYARKRAADLLKFGQAQKALDLLATRSERLPTSKLHYVESIARRMLPVPDFLGAESASEAAVDAARVSANADDLRDALEELVNVRRLRNDTAGVLRGLAELGNLGDALGDDLVVLETNVQGLESLAAPSDREQFTQSAVRVFSRLPDELVAKAPELSRRVAAQVGGSEPALLQRVLRVVGTGSLNREAASGLHEVLEQWERSDPQVSAFIPDVSKPPREIASAARHLASTREMDSQTAERFADWLGPLVSPSA
ncbi:AAA family ATPase [Rhizobium ruizarguesonis]|uniref:AAA family ATPase n=1 Tax=Rhizobium ruizarguesonis TaxID=2081791 RepID=UPI0013C01C41|nr:serine protease [Rhizobium ruizarguesonis]NEH32625.1 AAA family ATPase [Rhizobium ruizarguesonis]NEK13132.1 AAA family ATPase [Rhizobium ruizarguesonis]